MNEDLDGLKILLISASEPYVHYYRAGEVAWKTTAGGLATAFDSLLRTYNGTWVCLSFGNADKETSDSNGKIKVPPDEDLYTLKRVFISKKEEEGALNSSANGALWPLSHVAYVRPRFEQDAWEQYRTVNKKMADATIPEINEKSIIWVNDYQLTLCSKYIKEGKPKCKIGFFWHIPWPGIEVFKICPWKEEIINALLYNDLIGFHTSEDVNNFLTCVEKIVDCKVNYKTHTIEHAYGKSVVKSLGIGVDYKRISSISKTLTEKDLELLKKHYELDHYKIVIGVERLDYSKGIPEKLKALDLLLTRKPELIGKLTLLQIAAPSRVNLPEYKQIASTVLELVESLNYKYSIGNWKPVILINETIPLEKIIPLYKLADACIVTSLHDGMNLVSKEFVASNEGNGMLILSKFAGSSQELKEAILVNPYLAEEISQAIETALTMPVEEKMERMKKMKKTVSKNDVYNWAKTFASELSKT